MNKNNLSYKEKVKILQERIRNLCSYRSRIPDIPETPEVKKARETLAEWDKKNEANKDRFCEAERLVRNKANECLVLDDFDGAIAVIREYEESIRGSGK